MAKKTKSPIVNIFFCLLALLIGVCGGFASYGFYSIPTVGDKYVSGDLQFHFLELGNKFTGDCIYIKCGDVDIIIDAGSRASSSTTIYNYVSNYVDDGKIEFMVATHADQDHIAGFVGSTEHPGLLDRFEVDTFIKFAKTNKTTTLYNNFMTKINNLPSTTSVYSASDCYNKLNGAQDSYQLSSGISMNILYNYYYFNEASDENDYSVIIEFVQNDRHFLFTGDLEKSGEKYFIQHYQGSLTQVELYKAGHHGSKTSSTIELLEKIRPKIAVVTCVAGSDEYTKEKANQFPTQQFINNISNYTDKVYVTSQADGDSVKSMNGNIVLTSNNKNISVECSNNPNLLKDTSWFKSERVTPTSWA